MSESDVTVSRRDVIRGDAEIDRVRVQGADSGLYKPRWPENAHLPSERPSQHLQRRGSACASAGGEVGRHLSRRQRRGDPRVFLVDG